MIKNISNVMNLMSTLYSYTLQPVRIHHHHVVMSKNESEYIVKFQYCGLTHTQNYMSTYE